MSSRSQRSYLCSSCFPPIPVSQGSAKGGSALPLDASYYRAAFRNGSRARMKMFEQDFLCTYQWSTNLTTSDVATGMQWLRAMDEAASSFIDHRGQPASTTIQLCMMTPLHALASTELMQVMSEPLTLILGFNLTSLPPSSFPTSPHPHPSSPR